MTWIRDGTLIGTGRVTEIDLRTTRLRKVRGKSEYAWITVKGRTDRESERLAEQLLRLLNGVTK